jgi:hypothetical protein
MKAQVTLSADAQPAPEGKIHVSVSGDAKEINELLDVLNESIKTIEGSKIAVEVATAGHRARFRFQNAGGR